MRITHLDDILREGLPVATLLILQNTKSTYITPHASPLLRLQVACVQQMQSNQRVHPPFLLRP
jgi:hypothetical protein